MSAGSYADFFVALGNLESGDNYGFVSQAGYLGYYQFAEETLVSAGFYNGDSTAARDFSGTWTATAASYGVTDKASFLASPAAQDAAATAWFQKVYADLGTVDLIKYEGQTLNGFTITPSALLAGTHLVGWPALKVFLGSGGTGTQDGGGETVLDYMQRLSGYDTPFSFAHTGPATITGGPGSDSLHGWAGNDSLDGGAGVNTLRGGDGADTLQGGAGFDNINGNQGDDRIDGGAGGDDWLLGGQGNDQITAHAGANILNGNLGNDTVAGGAGDDTLRGGQGADVLTGGAGNNHLFGDLGNDALTGGAGADTFHFAAGGGQDRVSDFNLAQGDRIQIDGGARYTVAQVGADTVVDLGNGDTITLVGVSKASLTAGWIVG
ncbi:MAG TPA: calcium-binding protein [Phenylobacterium sp.]|uniref:calcium-binding protein n=1 Tax=Phenylobacterium sp. TaxID=1871053 RepID=UPI002B4A7314|nr:calcium-binding protein [Phenylobacterium sp.]HKR89728.1 calcium-binding protein [Phenylobacterium sp.]